VILRCCVAVLAVTVALIAGPAATVRAADTTAPTTPTATTTALTVLPIPSGIELPNSGQAPEFSGDRGGWAQITLFGVMTAAMLAIFVRVGFSVRQRTKARRLAADA
jgi:hypothetical protein